MTPIKPQHFAVVFLLCTAALLTAAAILGTVTP